MLGTCWTRRRLARLSAQALGTCTRERVGDLAAQAAGSAPLHTLRCPCVTQNNSSPLRPISRRLAPRRARIGRFEPSFLHRKTNSPCELDNPRGHASRTTTKKFPGCEKIPEDTLFGDRPQFLSFTSFVRPSSFHDAHGFRIQEGPWRPHLRTVLHSPT